MSCFSIQILFYTGPYTIGMGQMHDGLYLLQDSNLDQATTGLADFLSQQLSNVFLLRVHLLFLQTCFPFGTHGLDIPLM